MAEGDIQHEIVWYDPQSVVPATVASATVIKKGNLVSWESNAVVLMNTVTEDVTFCGVALGETLNGDTVDLSVCQVCILKAYLVSAAYGWGDGLMYDASNDDCTLVADGDTNTIAWIHDERHGTGSVTRALVYVNVSRLGTVADKLYHKVSA